MSPTHRPVLGELDRETAEAILRRNHVGRLAFTFRDRVDIEPIHYIYAHEWLYGRTSAGTKLTTLHHHPWVAFEVDEIHAPFDWTSVVVKGSFHRLDDDEDASPRTRLARDHALELLRALTPRALAPGDPTPWRHVLFRISVDHVTGREARPGT